MKLRYRTVSVKAINQLISDLAWSLLSIPFPELIEASIVQSQLFLERAPSGLSHRGGLVLLTTEEFLLSTFIIYCP
jgi:hypothetical protein